jgi:hypothetical protein
MKKLYGKGARLAALGLAAATVLSLAAPAFAGEKPVRPGAGMTAAIDAKGNLRQPTAAENQALVAGIQAMSKSAASLNMTQWPDGTVSIDLLDAFLNTSMVQVQADGTVRQVCVDSASDASAVLSGTPLLEEK